jgi:hypothetical protein
VVVSRSSLAAARGGIGRMSRRRMRHPSRSADARADRARGGPVRCTPTRMRAVARDPATGVVTLSERAAPNPVP